MGETFQDVLDVAFGELDLANDEQETLLKNLLSAGARALSAAQVVDLNKGDTDVTGYIRGMKAIAQIVGKSSPSITPEMSAQVKSAVSDLVDVKDQPLLSGALEELFNGYFDLIVAGKEFKAFADAPA